MSLPEGGGVAVRAPEGFQYRGRTYPTFADLPKGGYLVVPEILPLDEWQRLAKEHYEKTEQDCSKGDIL